MVAIEPEERDDVYGTGEQFQAVLGRFNRRQLLRTGATAVAAAAAAPVLRSLPAGGAGGPGAATGAPTAIPLGAAAGDAALSFVPVPPGTTDEFRMPSGYHGNVLIAWGDPIKAGKPGFHASAMTPAEQEQRFGYNCDYIAYLPMPFADGERRGLLWVNHEYTEGKLMFEGYDPATVTREQVLIELAAHGGTVLEVERRPRGWAPVLGSRFNRRITGTTRTVLTGPAAGHRLVKTSGDPSGGANVLGMLNNCGGGLTPWGTVLTAEENFNQYFANADQIADPTLKASYARYGLPKAASDRRWEAHLPRFDLAKEPNEANRYGWIVEIDPFDPSDTPRKRTALGRFKHEAATVAVAKDGRAVVYTGDDERFDYVYKFVTAGKVNPTGGAKGNRHLLDSGTLYVAKFDDDGRGSWIPVVHRDPRLASKFDSQAEVLIRCREAADLLGATKMDRPEDIETNPVNKRVYLAMTNNTNRGTEGRPGTDAANPRPNNRHGHVIELAETGDDPAALTFRWEMFLLCGPVGDESRKMAGLPISEMTDISCPDNLAFDHVGNLWIATDGQPGTLKQNDAIFAIPTAGPDRGRVKRFMTGPLGAEMTGPFFTPRTTALFASVQHPGESGDLEDPQSVWPDYRNTTMARPAVVWLSSPHGDRRVGS